MKITNSLKTNINEDNQRFGAQVASDKLRACQKFIKTKIRQDEYSLKRSGVQVATDELRMHKIR